MTTQQKATHNQNNKRNDQIPIKRDTKIKDENIEQHKKILEGTIVNLYEC